MLEPKFFPYVTSHKAKTEHGYEYSVLRESTPEDLKKEYAALIRRQDERIARGEPVFRF